MRLIHFVIILLIFQGCKNLRNEIKESIFSDSDEKELKMILTFFDEKVCNLKILNRDNLKSCYSKYLDDLTLIAKTGIFDIGISLEEQDSFFIQMNQKTFNEIFVQKKLYLNRKRIINNKPKIFPDTIPQYFFNVKGKYVQNLKMLGKDNRKIKEYHLSILKDPEIPMNLFNEVLMGYRNYDITNDNIRLLFALHYFLLNKKHLEIKKSEDKLNLELKSE